MKSVRQELRDVCAAFAVTGFRLVKVPPYIVLQLKTQSNITRAKRRALKKAIESYLNAAVKR